MKLTRENDRLSAINTCLVAVKLKNEALCKSAEMQLLDKTRICATAEARTAVMEKEVHEMESFVGELQEMLSKAEDAEKQAQDELNIQVHRFH